MDEPVISKFYTFYFVKSICGGIIALFFTVLAIYFSIFGNLKYPNNAYFCSVFFSVLLCVYFYFFSKSWKRITVTPTEIIVYDVVFKKQITIPYTDITRIGTYRSASGNISGWAFGQNFVVGFDGDKSVTINEGWYDNYNRLTMAIYNYKYGPGHGRDRYLAGRESLA